MATASLPMYDLPGVREATDALWAALARNMHRNGLANVPDRLLHDHPVRDLWSDPEMLVSQCCGFDVVGRYKGLLRPIATPVFNALGCLGENYCSVIVVSRGCRFTDVREMIGTIAVINGPESHSGMSALRQLVSQRHCGGRFFSEVKISGSHVASLDLVRCKQADVTSIDSVTLSLLNHCDKNTMDGLKVLGTTYAAPAPPYVVSAAMPESDVKRVQDAFVMTFNDPDLANCRQQLLVDGISLSCQEDYWIHEAFKYHAQKHGFPTLQ